MTDFRSLPLVLQCQYFMLSTLDVNLIVGIELFVRARVPVPHSSRSSGQPLVRVVVIVAPLVRSGGTRLDRVGDSVMQRRSAASSDGF